jgi:hypothetical protein
MTARNAFKSADAAHRGLKAWGKRRGLFMKLIVGFQRVGASIGVALALSCPAKAPSENK